MLLDLVIVGFEFSTYVISEIEGVIELYVVMMKPEDAPSPFTLLLSTENGTAGIVYWAISTTISPYYFNYRITGRLYIFDQCNY